MSSNEGKDKNEFRGLSDWKYGNNRPETIKEEEQGISNEGWGMDWNTESNEGRKS